jgi:hypothetical protein
MTRCAKRWRGGEGAGSGKTFETAGSPVAYQDAPEFAKFVADDSARLVAAVRNRQGE